MASNSSFPIFVFSTFKLLRPLCASKTRTIGFEFINLVNIFLLPAYFKGGIISIYEVIGDRFGLLFQKIASLIFLVTRVLADGVRFLATAVVVQVITGWSIELAVLVIGVITLLYTLSGGIRTVMWIDSIQFVLY